MGLNVVFLRETQEIKTVASLSRLSLRPTLQLETRPQRRLFELTARDLTSLGFPDFVPDLDPDFEPDFDPLLDVVEAVGPSDPKVLWTSGCGICMDASRPGKFMETGARTLETLLFFEPLDSMDDGSFFLPCGLYLMADEVRDGLLDREESRAFRRATARRWKMNTTPPTIRRTMTMIPITTGIQGKPRPLFLGTASTIGSGSGVNCPFAVLTPGEVSNQTLYASNWMVPPAARVARTVNLASLLPTAMFTSHLCQELLCQ